MKKNKFQLILQNHVTKIFTQIKTLVVFTIIFFYKKNK